MFCKFFSTSREFDGNLKDNPLYSILCSIQWDTIKFTNELHDYVLNSNGLKSFEVVLMCVFSLSVRYYLESFLEVTMLLR
jgi:hypothetical protein